MVAPPFPSDIREAKQLADALLYLHGKELCHGDIWSGNMMLSEELSVTLIDLGGARPYGSRQDECTTRRKLNLQYAAPEALQGNLLCPAHDCWSLGLVLAEIAIGATLMMLLGEWTALQVEDISSF